MEENKKLELRMYFFVPYNISGRQMGIQAGHALGRYCLKYGRYNPNHIVWDFLEKWETFIVLNGGTTNDQRDFEMIPAGSLNQIGDLLQKNHIEFAYMIEPDLNHALSALSFICDERVFNTVDYPSFDEYINNKVENEGDATFMGYEYFEKEYDRLYGEKTRFLKDLILTKKLA